MTKPAKPEDNPPKRKPTGKRTAAMTGYADRMMRPTRRPKKPRVTKGF